MFQTSFLPQTKLTAELTDKGRVYHTPDGTFYSVTTTIGRAYSTKYLDEWRERVGAEVAEQISTQARNRGTAVHKIFEDYITQSPTWRKAMPVNLNLFLKVKPFIDKHLTEVYGIEHQLFSKKLKAAGTADLIARWDNRFNAITDYKTSKRLLKTTGDTIIKYRLQATCYAMMVEEMHQIDVPYNMIIILVSDEREAQIDITSNSQYRKRIEKLFKEHADA